MRRILARRLGGRIKAWRDARHLSQPELADLVGVSNGAVAQWEAGDSYPRPEIIRELANAFGISPERLEYGGLPLAGEAA